MSLSYKHSYLMGFNDFSDGPLSLVRKEIKFFNAGFKISWIFLFYLTFPNMTLELSLLFETFPFSGFEE